MKTAIFNFLVLQVVIWAIVFSSNINGQNDKVNYASISDTWEVVKVGESSKQDVVLHYPTFNKLTLNSDGTYIRIKNNETPENGNWKLNWSKSMLTLLNDSEVKKYEIVQLPNSNSESFIIKEKVEDISSNQKVKYELVRM